MESFQSWKFPEFCNPSCDLSYSRAAVMREHAWETISRGEINLKYWSHIIGHFLNNKSVAHSLLIIYKSGFTNANMLETMHRDTNATLYPMHTF